MKFINTPKFLCLFIKYLLTHILIIKTVIKGHLKFHWANKSLVAQRYTHSLWRLKLKGISIKLFGTYRTEVIYHF
jgi:hypothetical protein